jgi:hypothetical protein
LDERDDLLIAHLSTDGFLVERCEPGAIEKAAASGGAEAIVIDADLPGALAAVASVRTSDGVVSTVPVVMLGTPGAALRTSLDAVEAGGDAFVPRPLAPEDVAQRLRALLELPGPAVPDAAPLPPPQAPPPQAPPPPEAAPVREGATGLSPALADVLRSAAVRAGGTEADVVLPALDDDSIDELIPPELLEPLDTPLDALADEALGLVAQHTPPPYSAGGPPRRSSNRAPPAASTRSVPPTPTITPLQVGGELRLTGAAGTHGAGTVLGAASRSRASGLIVVRSRGDEYSLSLTSGHLLAIRSSRSQDEMGPLLARLGYIPREAARFAAAPLDAGVRGAAMLAARGYVTADVLAQALARAAREVAFDLLALPGIEWEMRPLESAVEIPLAPRQLDQLLVLGARARIEPEAALEALGGKDATAHFRGERAALASLPLTRPEREALEAAHGGTLRETVEVYGVSVLPALLALAWLGVLRIEGQAGSSMVPPAPASTLAQERTRVRALIEAAEAQDLFALLGVSEWTTRGAALEALEARRTEVAGLRARHPDVSGLLTVSGALDELARLLGDALAWERYVQALRVR